MGYQESLIYIQPQEQVGQIVKEYLMARQQAPSGRFLADIPAAVRLQASLKGCRRVPYCFGQRASAAVTCCRRQCRMIGDCPDFARYARSRWRIYSICLTMRSGTGSKMSTLHTAEALNICRWTCILSNMCRCGSGEKRTGKKEAAGRSGNALRPFSMEHQMSFTKNAPDEEAVRLLRYYEGLALHYDARGYCVCTSEGKDSRVLGHLMRRAGVRHFYMHSVTGIDPPELVYFQRTNFQVYRDMGYLTYDVMYQYSMWQLMRRKKIPPLRKVRYCCEHLKERPVPQQGRAILSLGVRKYESVGRRKKRDELEIASDKKRGDSIIMPFDNSEKRRIFETCYQDNQRRINPLAYWTDSDIWSYSKDVGLKQCGLYNEGFERLGCIGCPMARRVGREQEFRRWPKFKAQYLRTFGHMLEDRRALGLPVLEFASTPEQWFEWWLNDKAADKADGNQLTLWGYEGHAVKPAQLLDDIAWELGVNISDLRLVPETKRQALDIMRHMRERERYPLHMWEEAVCYLTGAEVQFGDYGKIEAYFIGNTNYAADQF